MKFFTTLFSLLIFTVALGATAWGQPTIDDYRSATSGNWNATSTWERFDGTNWVSAVTTPTSANNVITIRSTHTVTVTASVTVDQVVVEAGGQITINPTFGLTIANGAGTDLVIYGTVLNSGLALFGSAGPTWSVAAGGTYIHNTTSAISTPLGGATLDAASNFIYRGSSTLTPAVSMSGRTYGNLTFESTSGSWTASPTGTGTLTINGDFMIGTGVTYNTAQTGVMTFAGNFTNNGTLTNSTGTQVYTFTGIGKTISGASAIEFETWNINAGASISLGRDVSIAGTFIGTVSGTLNCGTNNVTGAGTFTLASGATLGIGSTDGITSSGATGNIQTATRNFNTGANYIYNGTSAQVTGSGLPSTVNDLTINNASGVTLSSSGTVNGVLNLTNGNLTTGSNTLTIGGSGSVSRTSGHVVGNLAMNFGTGDLPATVFHIGTATAYTPATIDIDGTGGTAGTLIATTTGSAHPQIATSGLDVTKDIERYWTLTPGTAVLGDRTYKFKVEFLSSDVGGADPNNFEFRRYDGDWNTPTGGTYTRTNTTTEYSNFTSFSDFVVGEVGAAEPTVQATNVSFSSITSNSMMVSWTNGNGSSRLVLAKAINQVDAHPSDGFGYTANAQFGDGDEIGSGNYVVFSGSGSSVNVTGLSPQTVYHFRVFEFNGSGGTADYLISTATDNPDSQTTFAVEPTTSASEVNFTNVLTTSMDVNWTSGDGANRLVLVKEGSAVDANPVDGVTYTANASFGSGDEIGSGNYVAYIGSGSTFNLTGLTQHTTYHVAVYEFNGIGGTTNYKTTEPATGSRITATESSMSSDVVAAGNETSNIAYASYQSSTINTTSDGVHLWSFTIRDGGASSPDADALGTILTSVAITKGGADNVTSWANTLRQAALFDGSTKVAEVSVTGESISFSGLSGTNVTAPDDGSKTLDLYVTFESSVTDNQQFQFEITDANVIASVEGSLFGSFASQSSDVSGDANRIEVTAIKLDFTTQPSNGVKNIVLPTQPVVTARDMNNNTDLDYSGTITLTNSGSLSTSGNVVAASSGVVTYTAYTFHAAGSSITVSTSNDDGLTNGTSSPINILENEPTVQASEVNFTDVSSNSMTVNWMNGNGAERIVLMRAASAVNSNPVDGMTYTANATFGSGSQIGTGNFVVYKGAGTSVPVTGLSASTMYHVAVFEFNGSGGTENYLIPGAVGNYATTAQQYVWNQMNNSASWAVASNWTPARTSPAPTDIIVFNNGGNDTVTGITTQTIGQLVVLGNTNVTFMPSAAATLTIAGASGDDLVLAAGSSLNVISTSALMIALSTGATGSIGGSMFLGSAAHRINPADASSFVVHSGASITQGAGFSGNMFTNTGTPNVAIFQSGSSFYFRVGANPFGLTAPSSKVVFQTGSNYVHQTTGFPSLAGRTYANFTYDFNGVLSASAGSAAGVGVTMDNLTVLQGRLNLGNIGASTIKGNIYVDAGDTLTFPPHNDSLVTWTFAGTTPQIISGGGVLIFTSTVDSVIIASDSYVRVQKDMMVNCLLSNRGTLDLDAGVVSGSGTIAVRQTGSVMRASGWVSCLLKKFITVSGGAASATFEIGDATNYAPIQFSGSGLTQNFELTASTVASAHPQISTSGLVLTKKVNRYHTLTRGAANPGGTYDITFTFVPSDIDPSADYSNFVVKRYDGAWSSTTTGTRTANSTQATGVTAFGDFAVGEPPPSSFTITATAGANGTIEPSGDVVVSAGADQDFIFIPNTGYHVDSIYVDGGYAGDSLHYTFYNVMANHTIHVTFAINVYTITASVVGNGTIDPSGEVSVMHGTDTTFTIMPEEGYHIDSVVVDGVNVGTAPTYRFTNVSANHTITAYFSINKYALSLTIVGEGTVTKIPDEVLYDHGTTVRLVPTPNIGWLFSCWGGDTTSTSGNTAFVTMVSAKSVMATFTPDPVWLAKFRTATMTDWATAVDGKGKLKAVKCKPDKVHFKFLLTAPAAATGLTVKIGMVSTGKLTDVEKEIELATWTGAKEFTYTPVGGIEAGAEFQVEGIGVKGKPVKVKYVWATTPKATKGTVTEYILNDPLLPMPNYHNVGADLEAQEAFPLVIGNASGASSVSHVKYKDVLKSLNKGGTLHTGAPKCLDKFANGKLIDKQQKSLPPTKHDNLLFANVVALGLNLASSVKEKFPAGLRDLIYIGGRWDGKTINEIYTDANSYLGCDETALGDVDGTIAAELNSVIGNINSAFAGDFDTVAWSCGRLELTGVRAVRDVSYLRPNPGVMLMRTGPKPILARSEPIQYALQQNYPNPFNPTTTISFDLLDDAIVTLKVYNMLGQEIATLIESELYESGVNEVEFDATGLPSGVYFYRLTVQPLDEDGDVSNSLTQVKKMMLLK